MSRRDGDIAMAIFHRSSLQGESDQRRANIGFRYWQRSEKNAQTKIRNLNDRPRNLALSGTRQ
jgi:hypothetical protein